MLCFWGGPLQVKGHFIKNHLCVFVNGLVENPAFNSQSKETLTTKETQFGSSPKISDAGLKALEKSEIVDRYVRLRNCDTAAASVGSVGVRW